MKFSGRDESLSRIGAVGGRRRQDEDDGGDERAREFRLPVFVLSLKKRMAAREEVLEQRVLGEKGGRGSRTAVFIRLTKNQTSRAKPGSQTAGGDRLSPVINPGSGGPFRTPGLENQLAAISSGISESLSLSIRSLSSNLTPTSLDTPASCMLTP